MATYAIPSFFVPGPALTWSCRWTQPKQTMPPASCSGRPVPPNCTTPPCPFQAWHGIAPPFPTPPGFTWQCLPSLSSSSPGLGIVMSPPHSALSSFHIDGALIVHMAGLPPPPPHPACPPSILPLQV
eukprot:365445-Chlamydomonas_euryale.AAC.14